MNASDPYGTVRGLKTTYTRDASAHTPGPWHLTWLGRNGSHRQLFVEAEGPVLICDMQLEACVDSTCGITEADANLIAAAPELLTAVRNLCDYARRVASCWESGDLAGAVRSLQRERELAEAVLAKAEGKLTP